MSTLLLIIVKISIATLVSNHLLYHFHIPQVTVQAKKQ